MFEEMKKALIFGVSGTLGTKLVKKLNIPRIQLNTKKLNFVKKISFQSVINFILQPVFTAYENFREKRKIEK